MKQLLIVKSTAALNGGVTAPKDLSGMTAGSIGFFALDDYANWLSAAPNKNFAIAVGRGDKSPAFVIPEVDWDTLSIVEALPVKGTPYAASITIPSPAAGKTYGLTLVKLGTHINGERYKWSQSVSIPSGGSSTANAVAKSLRDGFQAMVDAGSIDVTVGGTNAAVTITGAIGDGWKLVATDDLYGTSINETTVGVPSVGDKAYIQKLARACAGNKGFLHTAEDAHELYPGYPEEVEDFTLNTSGTGGTSTAGYTVFNLRFATKRESGKQTDERIWQYVHIAVPVGHSSISTIRAILTKEAPLTKTAADALYEPAT